MNGVIVWVLGVLFGLAVADFLEASKGVEAPPPIYRPAVHPMLEEMSAEEREKSTCYALVPRHETYSVALNQGMTCVTVIGVTK